MGWGTEGTVVRGEAWGTNRAKRGVPGADADSHAKREAGKIGKATQRKEKPTSVSDRGNPLAEVQKKGRFGAREKGGHWKRGTVWLGFCT